MTPVLGRPAVVVIFIVAEIYQVFFGALTSLQLGAPGIGDRAAWAPTLLVDEGFTILPFGFVLCLWGLPTPRRIASICALLMIAVLGAAAVTLGRSVSEMIVFFVLLIPPPIALLASARVRRARAT